MTRRPSTGAAPANPRIAALTSRAAQLRRAGQPGEAIAPMAEAARLQPGDAEVWCELAQTCLEAARPQDAQAALRRALALAPRSAQAHWRMGAALEAVGDLDRAIAAYETAVSLAPSLGEAQFRLGVVLDGIGRRAEAVKPLRRAATTAKEPRIRRQAEARALIAEGRDAEAQQALRRALRLDPQDALLHSILGTVLTEAGAFEEAADCFEKMLALTPQNVGAYYELARCRRVTEGDPLIARMEEARGFPGVGDVARCRLELGLGKAYDDVGRYAEAMAAFDAAAQARGRSARLDLPGFEAHVERMTRVFTPQLMARAKDMGNPDPTPVLVLGMPRSGTTLLEQMLSNHPQVAGGGELEFWVRRGPVLELGPDGPSAAVVAQTAKDALDVLRRVDPDAPRVVDKMPFNFIWAGLIHLCLPNATLIHMRRRPIDTALSIHQTFFSPRLPFPTGGAELVAYFRSYQRLMAHWRAVLPPDRFIEIDYETLTREPRAQIHRALEAARLPWDEACLHPETNDRPVRTPSKWQAKQPVNPASVGRWRRYEPWLGPLAELLTDADRQT